MPYRITVFTEGETYHVLNRGVGGIPLFRSPKEYVRFLELIDYYRFDPSLSFSHYDRLSNEEKKNYLKVAQDNPPLVEIYAYCLMPNHFHILLKQQINNGISKMLSNIQNAYVRFYNTKHLRKGTLFESMFKAIRIENDEQFLHVSRYIHLNPSTVYLVKIEDLPSYPWSSLPEYLNKRRLIFTSSEMIIKMVGGREGYEKFVFDQAQYQRELAEIKHLILEN